MTRVGVRASRVRRRVYYILALLLVALPPATARAQVAVTVESMTKGAADAPITIVEFSDSQ